MLEVNSCDAHNSYVEKDTVNGFNFRGVPIFVEGPIHEF